MENLKASLKSQLKKLAVTIPTVFIILACDAQPSFNFQNGVRVSGTNLALNSRYRFTNVAAGTDALVTITALTGGATLAELDDVDNGYDKAFQPVIRIPANSNGDVRFRIDFVTSGSSAAKNMTQIPVTLVDIDGDRESGRTLYEYDYIEAFSGYSIDYEAQTELGISVASGWARGLNLAAVEYGGIDTLDTKVMFTITNYNRNSISIRLGVNNNTNISFDRLKSVFFKNFAYSNSALLAPAISNFKAVNNTITTTLSWEAEHAGEMKSIFVQRSEEGSKWETIGEIRTTGEISADKKFSFDDANAINGKAFYRLQISQISGSMLYSNVVVIQSSVKQADAFKLYPSNVKANMQIVFHAAQKENTNLEIINYNGTVVQRKLVLLEKGANNVQLNLQHLSPGIYLAVLRSGNNLYNCRFIKE